jgi:hypothetical protein
MEKGKVVFPYPDIETASKDGFKKLGGPAEAFRYMRKGYQELMWRARWEARMKERQKAEDAAFEAAKKKGD